MKAIKVILLLLSLFFFGFGAIAQNNKPIIPKLDTEKNTYELNFGKDARNSKVISAYMTGETEPDSLRFKAKISRVVERLVVTVLSDSENPIKVDIVKKHWGDIKRSGSTENGIFQIDFDTADEFGIILSSEEPNLPFDLAVWSHGEIIPMSAGLFYDASKTSKANSNPLDNTSEANSANNIEKQDNLILYLIFGILVIITLMLFFIFFRKRSKGINSILFLLLFMTTISVEARARRGNNAQIIAALEEKIMQLEQKVGQMDAGTLEMLVENFYTLDDYAGTIDALIQSAQSWEKFLEAADEQDVIDLDPNGQPRLPSSCLTAYVPDSRSEKNRNEDGKSDVVKGSNADNDFDNRSGNDTGTDSDSGSGNDAEFRPFQTAESNSKLDTKTPYEAIENTELPSYDLEGNKVNAGDYHDAPASINLTNLNPLENPFIDGSHRVSNNLRLPKYDSEGYLKHPGDFPDAPTKIDPANGLPVMNPFIDGAGKTGKFIRQPKYSDTGKLIDAGDFPDAPQQIDPTALKKDNSPGAQSESNSTFSSGDNNTNTNSSSGSISGRNDTNGSGTNSGQDNDGNGESKNSDRGKNGDPKNPEEGDKGKAKQDGCKCLEKAYDDLEGARLNLELLRVITARIDRVTDFGISFGDNFSGVHGVSGLAWQYEREKVLKSMEKFDKTYGRKHKELIKKLYDALIKIDHCENLLGFENWYGNAGFIYYEFMKERYRRKK